MSEFLRILNEVLDNRQVKREALAAALGMSIGTLSKMTTGVNAFGLSTFEQLDRDVQIAVVKRYGAEVLGLSVTELSVIDAAIAFMDTLAVLQAKARTLETVRAAQSNVKATLSQAEQRKVG